MKRKNIFRISVAFWAMTAFTSCSDQFMQDKQNFDSTTADAYNYWSGAPVTAGLGSSTPFIFTS